MKGNEGKVGTVILVIILLLIFAMAGIYGYLYVTKLENRIIVLEQEKTTLETVQTTLEEKEDTVTNTNNVINKEDKIGSAIKNYILTDFGPKNNMEEVNVIAYEEITAEEYFSKTPGGVVTTEEIEEYKTQNPNTFYGYCVYSIKFKDVNNLSMAGSRTELQKTVGDTMITEAVFTFDKTNNAVKFATSYGFSN